LLYEAALLAFFAARPRWGGGLDPGRPESQQPPNKATLFRWAEGRNACLSAAMPQRINAWKARCATQREFINYMTAHNLIKSILISLGRSPRKNCKNDLDDQT